MLLLRARIRPVLFVLLGLATLVQASDYSDIGQLLRSGQLTQARLRLERLMAAHPADPQLRLYKALLQRESGRLVDAIAILTKLSEDHPELPEPYNNLAVIYAAQGQYDKARIALEKALRTHPSYATAHNNLTQIYARLASQAYSKALQLEPEATPAHAELAQLQDLTPAPQGRTLAVAAPRPAPASTSTPAAAPVPTPSPAPTLPPQAKPAPAPPSVASASAASAALAAKPAPDSASTASAGVEQAVRRWAQAWSSRDIQQYLAAYAPTFETGAQSRAAWEQDRRARILGKSHISVQLLELQITVQGQHAVAKFRQDYKADKLAVLSRKTLKLTQSGQRWLIVKETSGGG